MHAVGPRRNKRDVDYAVTHHPPSVIQSQFVVFSQGTTIR
jgi:hypothetical protein